MRIELDFAFMENVLCRRGGDHSVELFLPYDFLMALTANV